MVERLEAHLGDRSGQIDSSFPGQLSERLQSAAQLCKQLTSSQPQLTREVLLGVVKRVEVGEERITLQLHESEQGRDVVLEASAAKIRSGREVKLVISGSDDEADARRDGKLVAMLARAHRIRDRRIAGESVASIAADEDSSPSRIGRFARLGLLAPDIVLAAVDGRQPTSLTRSSLWEATSIPLDWAGQRRLLGFS